MRKKGQYWKESIYIAGKSHEDTDDIGSGLLAIGCGKTLEEKVIGTYEFKQGDAVTFNFLENGVAETYRDGVRTKAGSLETAIAATTTIAELQAVDLNDGWPEELS